MKSKKMLLGLVLLLLSALASWEFVFNTMHAVHDGLKEKVILFMISEGSYVKDKITKLLLTEHIDSENGYRLVASMISWLKIYDDDRDIISLAALGEDVNTVQYDTTALAHAIGSMKHRNVIRIRALLAAGVDIDTQDQLGRSSLWIAAMLNEKQILKDLVAAGADVNLQARGSNVLISVVRMNVDKEIVEILIDAGIDIHARASNGSTALLAAVSPSLLSNEYPHPWDREKDPESNQAAVVSMLLAKGIDINAVNNSGDNALHRAVSPKLWNENAQVEIIRMLIEAGIDVNAQNNDGVTALIKAVRNDDIHGLEVIKMLIRAGADVNLADYSNHTPLDYVSRISDSDSIVKVLLEADAE